MKSPLDFRSPVRISLDKILIPEIKKLKGSILDVGAGSDSPYKQYMIPWEIENNYTTLDIDPSTNPDIVSPIEFMNVPDNFYDNVLATEVLEHSANPQKAIDEIWRVLIPGGKCILTTRFMYPYHPNPRDFYRFSEEAHIEMFKKFRDVKIISQGNRLMLMWEMINPNMYTRVILNIFNWFVALFDFKDEKFAMGYLIVAEK